MSIHPLHPVITSKCTLTLLSSSRGAPLFQIGLVIVLPCAVALTPSTGIVLLRKRRSLHTQHPSGFHEHHLSIVASPSGIARTRAIRLRKGKLGAKIRVVFQADRTCSTRSCCSDRSIVKIFLRFCLTSAHVLPPTIAILDALHGSRGRGWWSTKLWCSIWRTIATSLVVEWRERDARSSTIRLRLLAVLRLCKLAGKVAIHVRRIWVQAPEMLMHDLNLRLQHVVLLLCLSNVFAVAL